MIGDDDYFKELYAQLDREERYNKIAFVSYVVFVTIGAAIIILCILSK